jgi:hypothetical protein
MVKPRVSRAELIFGLVYGLGPAIFVATIALLISLDRLCVELQGR